MKLINNYYVEDDFIYQETTAFGKKLFFDSKCIYGDLNSLLYSNQIGHKCEKCGSFVEKNSICNICRQKEINEKYCTLDVVDQTEFLYSDYLDEFFDKDDWSPIYDHLSTLTYDEIISMNFNRFRIHPCKDAFGQTIDIQDYFEEVPEEFDLDTFGPIEEIDKLVDQVNKLILSQRTGCEPMMDKRISLNDDDWLDMKKAVIEDLQNERT